MLTATRRSPFLYFVAAVALVFITGILILALTPESSPVPTPALPPRAPAATVHTPPASPPVPRLAPPPPQPPRHPVFVGTPADPPRRHGPYSVSFATPARRVNEREMSWRYRIRFTDQYNHFIRDADLTPEQEEALRGVYADTQLALDFQSRAPTPDELAPEELARRRSVFEADLQKTLQLRLAQVLTADQGKILQRSDYYLLRLVSSLGFDPLVVTPRSP